MWFTVDDKRALKGMILELSSLVRIAIIHPHVVLRQGLKDLIEQDPTFQIVLEGPPASITHQIVKQHKPHIVISDETFCAPLAPMTFKVLILCSSDEIKQVRSAFSNRVSGYIPLSDVPFELMDALYTLKEGHIYLGKTLQTTLPDHIVRDIYLTNVL